MKYVSGLMKRPTKRLVREALDDTRGNNPHEGHLPRKKRQ